MPDDNWFLSDAFVVTWKDAFRNLKVPIEERFGPTRSTSKRERTGSLWTQINRPIPGIHLLAIEMQPDVMPLSIRLKVWTDGDGGHIYSVLRKMVPPTIAGTQTILSAEQKPRSSWESQLKAEGISLIGLSYRLDVNDRLDNRASASSFLREIGFDFVEWLLRSTTTESKNPTIFESSHALSGEAQTHPTISPVYPDEIPTDREYFEGSKKSVQINAYERSAAARQACIEHYGLRCFVCEFDFESEYGEIGRGFIHVHHEVPLHQIDGNYAVDPIADLKPVCPNCHSMLHKGDPVFSIEELRTRRKRT